MDKGEVLKNCTVDGNIIKLPDVQLDRKVFLEVKKALVQIGGKWKGGKTWGFVFSFDPSSLLNEIQDGKNINLKKDFQFFETPNGLARRLVELADIKINDLVLEPSAGQGRIINWLNHYSAEVEIFELMESNIEVLNKKKKDGELFFNFIGKDFLESDTKRYDKIVANPPFSKNQDITHILKMYDKLKNGGRMVTFASRHWMDSKNEKEKEFRDFLKSADAEIINLESGEFSESGTKVPTVIIIIDKK